MITPNQFKKGAKIEVDGEPYSIVEYLHIKMGRGGANVRTKIKSLLSGNVIERTYKSDEKIKQPDFEEKEMQYLYKDGDSYVFMDNETYEQVYIPETDVGELADFMPENLNVYVLLFNQKPTGVQLPNFVELPVAQTDPGLKGDTVSGGSKPATVSTGGVVQVPLFINEGDVLKIDTRTGTYMERVRSAR
ncbi:elongation factor P [Geovibrio thiophilus]|uniref:Elongation factor P n=1 Tax=Geovibrio thiophilus TaxID=139438 RepID=A0A410K1V0_9BACT|nr:elongation factor P [Geovibrio thiophilus]QAR34275.1 elongation factor P [Geovibrio thiophilus]